MPSNICGSCRYCVELSDTTHICNRFPPVYNGKVVEKTDRIAQKNYIAEWPIVQVDKCACGEYKA